MDDQNQNKMFMPTRGEDTSTQPPRFHRPHISQEPINDPEPEYVTRNRYQTLEDAQTGRKHMGVASGDPVYLKDAPLSKNSAASDEPLKASAAHQQRGSRPKQTITNPLVILPRIRIIFTVFKDSISGKGKVTSC